MALNSGCAECGRKVEFEPTTNLAFGRARSSLLRPPSDQQLSAILRSGSHLQHVSQQLDIVPNGNWTIITAAQRVEHYEISAYGSARALAEHLGHSQIASLLQVTLDEESAADKKLTGIAEGEAYAGASQESGDETGGSPPKSSKKPSSSLNQQCEEDSGTSPLFSRENAE